MRLHDRRAAKANLTERQSQRFRRRTPSNRAKFAAKPGKLPFPEVPSWAARFIRILKEDLLRVRWLDATDLRQALLKFQRIYNEQWLIERHGHRPPADVRRDQSPMLLAA